MLLRQLVKLSLDLGLRGRIFDPQPPIIVYILVEQQLLLTGERASCSS